MPAQIVPIFALLLSSFFLLAGSGLQGILLPVRGSIEGWSTYEIGLFGTGYAIAFTLGCLIVPRVVKVAGHVRTFSSLAALLAIAILLHALIIDPIAWIVIRGLSGFGIAGTYMVIESWLNERVTNETRGKIFSLYMIVTMTAMMGGQFVMPLAGPGTTVPFMLCAIFFAMAVIPNALSRAQSPKPLVSVSLDLKGLYRNSPVAAVGIVLAGIIAGAWVNMAPVYGERVGLSTTQIATLLVATMAGGVVFQYPLGRLSDRIDRRYVMLLTGLLGFLVAGFVFMAEVLSSVFLFGAAFILGGAIFPAYSLSNAHANDHAADEDFVKVSSGLLILYGFGTMAGPLVAAGLMDMIGPRGIFVATGVSHVAYGAYAYYRTFRREAVPAEIRPDYQVTPLARAQTPASFVLDPRSDAPEDIAAE